MEVAAIFVNLPSQALVSKVTRNQKAPATRQSRFTLCMLWAEVVSCPFMSVPPPPRGTSPLLAPPLLLSSARCWGSTHCPGSGVGQVQRGRCEHLVWCGAGAEGPVCAPGQQLPSCSPVCVACPADYARCAGWGPPPHTR